MARHLQSTTHPYDICLLLIYHIVYRFYIILFNIYISYCLSFMYYIVNRLYIILFIVYILCNITGKRVSETLEHSQFSCTGNKETPVLLIKVLKSYDLEVTPSKVLTLDVNLESHMEIPLVGIIATTLSTIWTQRQKGSVCAAKTRAQLKPDVECLGREIAPPCKMLPLWVGTHRHTSNVCLKSNIGEHRGKSPIATYHSYAFLDLIA